MVGRGETWVSVVALALGLGWSLAVMGGLVAAGGALFAVINAACLLVSAMPWALHKTGLFDTAPSVEIIPLEQVVYAPDAIEEIQRPERLSRASAVESGHFLAEEPPFMVADTGRFAFDPEEVAQRITESLCGMDFGADPELLLLQEEALEFDGWEMPDELPLESLTVEARVKVLEDAIRDDEARQRAARARRA